MASHGRHWLGSCHGRLPHTSGAITVTASQTASQMSSESSESYTNSFNDMVISIQRGLIREFCDLSVPFPRAITLSSTQPQSIPPLVLFHLHLFHFFDAGPFLLLSRPPQRGPFFSSLAGWMLLTSAILNGDPGFPSRSVLAIVSGIHAPGRVRAAPLVRVKSNSRSKPPYVRVFGDSMRCFDR